MSDGFYGLRVLDTRKELDGAAKTVTFDVPQPLSDLFRWRAGQHLSFRFSLNGQEVRRSYSISNSPHTPQPLQITVKRVRDGLVSNYINDDLAAGDTVEVMPPFGQFSLTPDRTARRTHYFFAAGSGITPIFAMLHSVLLAEPWSDVRLLYGNQNAESVLFREALATLEQDYAGRFALRHVLSKPSLWSGFAYWRRGRIDAYTIGDFLETLPPYAQDAQYNVCGPGAMNLAVREGLAALDVPATRIHSESYGGAQAAVSPIVGVDAKAQIELSGRTHTVKVAAGQTLLDATLQAGMSPPHSCQSGVCGACRVKLVSGEAKMRARMALSDDDIADGHVLACQALPQTPELALKFE